MLHRHIMNMLSLTTSSYKHNMKQNGKNRAGVGRTCSSWVSLRNRKLLVIHLKVEITKENK